MLTKTQKQILKATIELSHNGLAIIDEYEISRKLNIHPNTVFKAVKVLVRKDLLEQMYQEGTTLPKGVMLTSYPLNLNEYNWLQIRKFLVSNLIAIIALVISIIALFLPVQRDNDVQNGNGKSIILKSIPFSTPNKANKTNP